MANRSDGWKTKQRRFLKDDDASSMPNVSFEVALNRDVEVWVVERGKEGLPDR